MSEEELAREREKGRLKAKRLRDADPAKAKARRRGYYEKDRERDPARIRQQARTSYRKHQAKRLLGAKDYRTKNKEKLAARNHELYVLNIDVRKQKDRARYQANREKELQRRRDTDAKYPERRLAAHRKWCAKNPTKVHANSAKRRALEANVPINDFTAKQWRAMCKACGYRCAYCHQKFPFSQLTMDHITPLSKGGAHTLSNIIPACKSCNSRKHAKDVPTPIQPFLLVEDAAAD
jgi:5-methylcytosine-specific restriction endonuclease McrA